MCRTRDIITTLIQSDITLWPLRVLFLGCLFTGCAVVLVHVNVHFSSETAAALLLTAVNG